MEAALTWLSIIVACIGIGLAIWTAGNVWPNYLRLEVEEER